ncbi:MAG: 3-hydroxyacyl-ACP dehydratase FabZ [Desulfobacterales bacterium]|jgi:3-hydroxyacyl-[acyl-carrier-protein] dehydratase
MEHVRHIREILDRLPHRYPFVMVDRILEIESGKRILTLKNVTINEPFFQGHFPENPVMPGVLILEALAQSGALLAFESMPEERRNVLIYFAGVNNAKFRKVVIPGDQLVMEVNLRKLKSKAMLAAGKATVDGQLVTEADLLASIGERT